MVECSPSRGKALRPITSKHPHKTNPISNNSLSNSNEGDHLKAPRKDPAPDTFQKEGRDRGKGSCWGPMLPLLSAHWLNARLICITFICVFMRRECIHHTVLRAQLAESVSSRDQTEIVSIGSKLLQPLSQLIDPMLSTLIIRTGPMALSSHRRKPNVLLNLPFSRNKVPNPENKDTPGIPALERQEIQELKATLNYRRTSSKSGAGCDSVVGLSIMHQVLGSTQQQIV